MAIALMASSAEASAQSASDLYNRAVGKLKASTGSTADFAVTYEGRTVRGQIKSKGKKFAVTSPSASSWYNGKELVSYNASTSEATWVNPTEDELGETNPLAYLYTAGNYNVSHAKGAQSGKTLLQLVPNRKGSNVKMIILTIDKTTLLPEKMVITPVSGQKIVVGVSNLKLNTTVADSEFNFPKSKYPKAIVVDLR